MVGFAFTVLYGRVWLSDISCPTRSEVGLGSYASLVGVALIATIVTLGTIALLRGTVSIFFNRSKHDSRSLRVEIMRAMETVRGELDSKFQKAEAAAATTKRIAEAVIAAVRPIEAALRDLSSRVGALEDRAEGSDRRHADHSSLSQRLETSLKNALSAVAEMDKRLGDAQGKLAANVGRLTSIDQTVERVTLHVTENRRMMSDVESRARAIDAQFAELSRGMEAVRVEFHEQSEALQRMADAIGRLDTTSDQTLQRVDAADQRLAELSVRIDRATGALSALSAIDDQLSGLSARISELERTANLREAPGGGKSDGRAGIETGKAGKGAAGGGHPTIAPGDRGGHPRTPDPPPPREIKPTMIRPKLGLAAIRPNGHWQIFAEVTADDRTVVRVMEGERPLDHVREHLFGPLQDLHASIRIFQDGDTTPIEKLSLSEPLLFRAVGDDFARSTRRPSQGLNMAVVPSDWQFDHDKCGAPPFEPESMAIPGFSVHHFHPERNPLLSFNRPGTHPFELFCAKPDFWLSGQLLSDVEGRMGPLIVETPPVLEGDSRAMVRVQTVVIGAEGPGSEKWRRVLKDPISGAWRIPDDVLPDGSGWYFIRLYDDDDELLDSLDFRYIPGLKSIEVSQSDEVFITFEHDQDVQITPTGDGLYLVSATDANHLSTTFGLPWDPRIRQVTFEVSDGDKPVRVSVDVDRIWWRLGCTPAESEPPWQSLPMQLTAEHFTGAANIELLLRLPCRDLEAFVGFRSDIRQPVRAGPDGDASLRLYQFSGGFDPVQVGQQTLKLWVRGDGTEDEIDIACVISTRKCRWCESCFSREIDLVEHVLTSHHSECFDRLNLHGAGVHGSGIPTAIYVCLECGQSYPHSALPSENPVTLLGRHSDERHKRTSYKRVDNRLDIMNLLGLDEKWVWKCRLDGNHIVTPVPGNEEAMPEKRDHLREEHLIELVAHTGLED